jgi:hypothetical protein
MPINAAKATDTADAIMGAGAQTYEWYRGEEHSHIWDADANPYPDWHTTLIMEDPSSDGDVRVDLNHQVVMKQARYVLANKGKKIEYRPGKQMRAWSEALERECTALVFHVDDADFDANTADELIQLCAYSEVPFG